jgi:hypothetical protein
MRKYAPFLLAGALVAAGTTTAWAASRNHHTHLTGAGEVPAVVTGAQGQATFKIADDGQSIEYKLNVSNMEAVVQAHIHVGPVDGTGPVVVFLFGPVPGGVDVSGRLASGTFTAANLVGTNWAGRPLSDLIAEIESGNAYVNVHTVANPPGEIRGQL